jgi:hypothetical protein
MPFNFPKSVSLLERYSPSTNAITAFWDFYGLYFLWFKVEGWQGKYDTGVIANEAKVRLIRDSFWSATVSQAKYLGAGVLKAVKDEFSNIYDDYLIPPELIRKWGYDNPTLYAKIIELRDQSGSFWDIFTIPDLVNIFNAPFWRNSESDLYGGPPWAKICQALGVLLEATKVGDMSKLAMAIDNIYDLDHNTGSISSKFPAKSRVDKDILDKRAAIKSLDDFIPLVSPSVRGMINSVLRMGECAVSLFDVRRPLLEASPEVSNFLRLIGLLPESKAERGLSRAMIDKVRAMLPAAWRVVGLEEMLNRAENIVSNDDNFEVRKSDPTTIPQALRLILGGANPQFIVNRWAEHRNQVSMGRTTTPTPFT